MQNNNSSVVRVLDFRGTYKSGGGPDKTILNSAARHDKNKVWILVCYLRQPSDAEFQISEWAARLEINYVDFIDRTLLDWSCLLKIKKLILDNKITLVHTHDDKTLLYGCLVKLLIPSIRIMHTCHSHPEYKRCDFPKKLQYFQFLLRKRLGVFLMQRHNKPILTVSQNTRQRLINSGVKAKSVAVLHNGIDTDYWSRAGSTPILREELGLQSGQLLIGTVARITYDKDLPTFYKVAGSICQKYPDTRFVIVGDGYGAELPQARNQVTDLGLDKYIHFAGHRSDLKNIYASLDLFLMTSITEGLPNTVLEAMAMEVPVISTGVGGVPEIVLHGQTGLLCPVGDTNALGSAIAELIQNEPKRRQFGREARKHILQHFDFSHRIKRLEDYYCFISSAREHCSHLPSAESGN